MKGRMPKPEVMPEKQTRDKILAYAKRLGCFVEVKQLMDKYDGLLRRCTNESERKHIATIGVTEIHKLIGFRGGLSVGGELIIPDDNEKDPD